MIEVKIDGLAEPSNPGIGTYAYLIYRDGILLGKGYGTTGDPVTNNYAEYEALIQALKELHRIRGEDKNIGPIIVKSDSKLLVNQMKGVWKIHRGSRARAGSYHEKHDLARALSKDFPFLQFVWVPREENTDADALSRVAYEEELAKRRRSYRLQKSR